MATIYRCDVCKAIKERREDVQEVQLPALEVGAGGFDMVPDSIRPVFSSERSRQQTRSSYDACAACVHRVLVAMLTLPPSKKDRVSVPLPKRDEGPL